MAEPDRLHLPILRPGFGGWCEPNAGRVATRAIEPAVTRAINKVVGEADAKCFAALKGALADAQQKMAGRVKSAPSEMTQEPWHLVARTV